MRIYIREFRFENGTNGTRQQKYNFLGKLGVAGATLFLFSLRPGPPFGPLRRLKPPFALLSPYGDRVP